MSSRIAVLGLGYVGCVSAACLAAQGHRVVGVDVNQVKVDLIAAGKAPVVEERIGELTAEVVASGALRATTEVADAIADSDVSLICVGTPSAPNGSLATTYLERVSEEIAQDLAAIARDSILTTGVSDGDAPAFSAAYLVTRQDEPRLVSVVEALGSQLGGCGFSFEIGGPWPPYHFTDLRLEAEHA